jgi:hypothetical protein
LGEAGDQLLQIERVQHGGFEEAVYVRKTRVAPQITKQGAGGGEQRRRALSLFLFPRFVP